MHEIKWYFKVCYEIMSYFHYILGTFRNILGIFLIWFNNELWETYLHLSKLIL
jgi:hypothetical protein